MLAEINEKSFIQNTDIMDAMVLYSPLISNCRSDVTSYFLIR
jgi:hypothetical protein